MTLPISALAILGILALIGAYFLFWIAYALIHDWIWKRRRRAGLASSELDEEQ